MPKKVEKSRNTMLFQCFVAPDGRKIDSLKRRVRGHLAGWEIKNQNVKNTSASEHSWKLSCAKCTRRCGAKVINLSSPKHFNAAALFEVESLKKCARLRREAHVEVKTVKSPHCRSTFERGAVEKLQAALARSTF